MEPATAYTTQALDDGARHAALRAVLKLLEHWQCSEKEKMALLGVGRSTLHKYQSQPDSARVSQDLLERLNLVLEQYSYIVRLAQQRLLRHDDLDLY